MYRTMIINTITSREDRATITAIIGVSSLLSFESELPEGGKVSGVVARSDLNVHRVNSVASPSGLALKPVAF